MSAETLFEQKVTAQDQRAGTSIEVGQEESDSVESSEESQLDMFGDIFDGDLVDDDAEVDEPQDALPDDDEQTPVPEGELEEDREQVRDKVEEPQAEPQAKPEPRNYEEFDEAERPLLKQMSNAAFEKYAKNRSEMLEAKQQLEELRTKLSLIHI